MLPQIIHLENNIPEIITKNINDIITDEIQNQLSLINGVIDFEYGMIKHLAEEEENSKNVYVEKLENLTSLYGLFITDNNELNLFLNLVRAEQVEKGNFINIEFLSESLGDNSTARKDLTATFKITVYSQYNFDDNENVEYSQQYAHTVCLRMLKFIEKILDYQENMYLRLDNKCVKRINKINSLDLYHNPEISGSDTLISGSLSYQVIYDDTKFKINGESIEEIDNRLNKKYNIIIDKESK